MHIVEADEQWALAGELLEEASDRPERLLGRRGTCGLADRRADQLRDSRPVIHAGQERRQPLLTTCLEDDVSHGPECDRLPVREAASAKWPEPSLELREQLGDEAGLPDPGRPHDREQPAVRPAAARLGGLLQERQLDLAVDDGSVEPTGDTRGHGVHVVETERRDGLLLALDAEALPGPHLDRVPDERIRRSADQDLAGPCGLLEALGQIDRVSRDERGTCAGIARHHFTRVDADPAGQGDVPGRLQLGVQLLQTAQHRHPRAHRPQRIVLVHGRHPEDGHDLVTAEPLDDATVALHDRLHLLEVPRHRLPHGLRIVLLAQHGRIDDVAEEDRHRLPHLLPRTQRRGDRRAAIAAEAGRIRNGCAATKTRRHRLECRPHAPFGTWLEDRGWTARRRLMTTPTLDLGDERRSPRSSGAQVQVWTVTRCRPRRRSRAYRRPGSGPTAIIATTGWGTLDASVPRVRARASLSPRGRGRRLAPPESVRRGSYAPPWYVVGT